MQADHAIFRSGFTIDMANEYVRKIVE